MNRLIWGLAIAAAASISGATAWYFGQRSPIGTPSDVKGAHAAALDTVPGSANIVATLDLEWLIAALVDKNLGLFPVETDPATVRTALTEASKQVLGIDVLAARRITLWASMEPPSGGAFIEGDFGATLAGEKASTYKGVDLVRAGVLTASLAKGGLLIGTEGAVEAAIDIQIGGGDPLGKSRAGEAHIKALGLIDEGFLVISASVGDLELPLPEGMSDLRSAAAALRADGGLRTGVVGGAKTLDALVDGYETSKRLLQKAIEKQLRDARTDRNFAAIVLLTIASDKLPDLFAALTVTRDGEHLTASVPGPVGAIFLSGLAQAGLFLRLARHAAAVVAVPAYLKYMRRAKTTEAIDHLDRLYKASASYYASPSVRRDTGERIPCQFPASIPISPGKSCCDPEMDKDGDDRCDVQATGVWDSDGWSALNFSMNDQHYFRYAYSSNGLTGGAARFTVSAHADLDCDGELSTFERFGYGDNPDANGECWMKGSPAFFKNLETD